MATKPGIKTSEFWLSLLPPVIALVGVVLAAFGISFDVEQVTAFAVTVASSALASHGYSASRGAVKSAHAWNATEPTAPSAQGDLY